MIARVTEPEPAPATIFEQLAKLLIGQPEAIQTILPFVQMHQAGLSPEGRPVGVILLLGPTGSGKTHTVESLATVLHGSAKKLLKVDCGEFQSDHEVAKLIGSPPGYLGHRETEAMLAQKRINDSASNESNITLILFDEIEKAAPAMHRMLLGILDKATLRLGDNTSVNFERCLIFLTSNLGAKAMQKSAKPDFGFESMLPAKKETPTKLNAIGVGAVKRKFSPEFVNRIDSVITYQPLNQAGCERILDHILADFSGLITQRLGVRLFFTEVATAARNELLKLGVSTEFGARELKRVVQRNFIQPVAAMVAAGEIPAGSTVILTIRRGKFYIQVRQQTARTVLAA